MISRGAWWVGMAFLGLLVDQLAGSQDCQTGDGVLYPPSLFVFGASMMDTGENIAAFPFSSNAENPPYGMDYWGHPENRLSNGRVISDHLCLALGKPFLTPYLQFGATHFSHGVNFASSGSTAISSKSISGNFPLKIQIDQFQVFKNFSLSTGAGASRFPTLENFEHGLYVFEFGTNDFLKLQHGYEREEDFFRDVLSAQKRAITRLRAEGAQNIIVFNVPPLGCTPSQISGTDRPQHDEFGCLSRSNSDISRFNKMLKRTIDDLRHRLKLVNLVLFDFNKVFLDAISNPSHYGLKHVHASCCGAGGGEYNYVHGVHCGSILPHNGLFATGCEHPSEYIFWDSLHPTDSFAGIIAAALVGGGYSNPPVKFSKPCPLQNS